MSKLQWSLVTALLACIVAFVGLRIRPPVPQETEPTVHLRDINLKGGVSIVAYSPNGKFLLTKMGADPLALRDASTLNVIRLLRPELDRSSAIMDITHEAARAPKRKPSAIPVRIGDVRFSPDSSLVAGAAPGKVFIWNTKNGELKRVLSCETWRKAESLGHTAFIQCVRFSGDGLSLATSDVSALKRQTRPIALKDGSFAVDVHIWDVQTGRLLRTLNGTGVEITGLDYSPDSHVLATAENGKAITLWDAKTAHARTIIQDEGASLLAFSPNGRWLLTADTNGSIEVREASSGHVIGAFLDYARWLPFVISPDSHYVLAPSAQHKATIVNVWRLPDSKKPLARLNVADKDEAITALSVSANSRTLAVAHNSAISFYNLNKLIQ